MVIVMKYVIALDLDGTLLDDNAKLSDKTISYIRSLDKDDYKVVITTGRPFQGMITYYDELGLDTLAICNSGTSVVLPVDSSFKSIEHPLDEDLFISFFKKAKHCINSGIYNVENMCFLYNRRTDNEFLKHVARNSVIIEGPFDETYISSPNGVLLIINEGMEKEFEEIVNSFDILGCRSWGNFYGNDFYEVYQKKYNKATSLEEVLKYYNVTKKQLICIGDSINDYEMLKCAGVSVSMLNGNEKIKKYAKHVTKYDNNNDGVVNFLEEFLNTKNG